MSLMFGFELGPLAARVRYLDHIENTEAIWEIAAFIQGYRKSIDIPPAPRIPI